MTMLCYYTDFHNAECDVLLIVMLNINTMSVIMLYVVMLSVVAPSMMPMQD
jgi:hypothetical protein